MTLLLNVSFEFDNLEIAQHVNALEAEIREIISEAVWEAGKRFVQIRDVLKHNKRGGFEAWCEANGWVRSEIYRYISIFEAFPTVSNLRQLDIGKSALYLLAAPSTPAPVREAALQLASQGQRVTYTAARNLVANYKPNYPPATDQLEQEGGEEASESVEVFTFDEWINSPIKPLEETSSPQLTPVEPVAATAPIVRQSQPMQLFASSLNDSWRTPSVYIEAARTVMGGIDLDPASSVIANQIVKAGRIFTKEDNGLLQSWHGRIWLNPPYGKTNGKSNQGLFAAKFVDEYRAGNMTEGIILVNLYAGYEWFEPLRELPRCELNHRISFINPQTDQAGEEAKASSVFIYAGPNPPRFFEAFKEFGVCGKLTYSGW